MKAIIKIGEIAVQFEAPNEIEVERPTNGGGSMVKTTVSKEIISDFMQKAKRIAIDLYREQQKANDVH